ncbi:transferrin receptor protein 1-like isoform X2 [Antennarius striatus]|uniref:transferrin receptor protein 1-like isoform X2 n=1 Tax=Antennarius striatus TaxID=241820 RepID=UPI0035B3A3C8
MDQARSTISKIFNGEPHCYTRFNLTQNMEGDSSQVEMKLSSDVDEEVGGNGVGGHLNHNSNRNAYVTHKLGRSPRSLCFMAVGTLLIFIIGFLIGYVVYQKKREEPLCKSTVLPFQEPLPHETGAAPLMDWEDVMKFLNEKFSNDKFEAAFRDFSSDAHQAGSPGDESLANRVMDLFSGLGMKTWTDQHFVKVQDPPASGSNKIRFRDQSEERLEGFLSYSGTGTVSGAVLYAHYGQEEDFSTLRDKNIHASGRVVLLRAGRITFAEKVANAAKMNATAVLIYPDPEDFAFADTTQLFGHVHLGSGDPYTPGFPSFNHTQFPPIQSSGLPPIPAQTVPARVATGILRQLGGPAEPEKWGGIHQLGGVDDLVTLEVNNVLTEKKIHNVFGVLEGFVDKDRYVVIGAQRDAWGPGFAKSTVGTSVLVELARAIADMKGRDGFKPRRSIVFASWSAGEYGSVGATEWLEGYLSSLSTKAFTYVDLDGVVSGLNGFKVSGSPLLYSLIENALAKVSTSNQGPSLLSQFGKGSWQTNMLEPLRLDDTAYPFLTFSGIPSVSFRFTSGSSEYPYFGTMQDTREKLNAATSNQVPQLAQAAARFAGHVVLRLVHDRLLRIDVTKYHWIITSQVAKVNAKVNEIRRLCRRLVLVI